MEDGERKIQGYLECDGSIVRISSLEDIKNFITKYGKTVNEISDLELEELTNRDHDANDCIKDDCGVTYKNNPLVLLSSPGDAIKNYKIKEYLKWYKIYDNKKHFVVKQKIMNFLMNIFMLSIGILSIFIFFYAINDYKIEDIIDLNKRFNIESKDIIVAQISNTLIIISVISLLSGLSESYILGKKHINVIFPNNNFWSLLKIFIILVFLLFVNIIECLKDNSQVLILMNFLTSLILIFYICIKMIWFYTHKNWFGNNLLCMYLEKQKKHINNTL